MFKIFLGVVAAAWLISSVITSGEESNALQQRQAAQSEILLTMDGLHRADVSTLVDEWRDGHSDPSASDLEELRLLAQRVKADPTSAARYTVEAKEDHLNSLPYTPLFGWGQQSAGLAGAVPPALSSSSTSAAAVR